MDKLTTLKNIGKEKTDLRMDILKQCQELGSQSV